MQLQISDQVKLHPLSLDDAESILAIVDQERQDLGSFLNWVNDVTDLASCQHYLSARVNSPLPGARWFSVRLQNECVGVFAVKRCDDENGIAELGYWLAGKARGKKVINSIVEKVSQQLKQQQIRTLEFRCENHNHASIRVAEKAGGVFKGRILNRHAPANMVQYLNVYHAPI